MSNPNYQTSDYTAFAIEQVLKRDWEFQVTAACPILACIKDRGLNWRKGYEVQGLAALVPLVFTDISTLTSGNAGIADANEIPTSFPTFDATEGFTHARFEYTHFGRSLTIKESERVVAGGTNGARGNLIDGKIKQFMGKMASIMADQVSGAANGSRTTLGGVDYAIATNNTYGGIDRTQSGNAYFRGNVDATGGTVSFVPINNAYDGILRHANEEGDTEAPDLMLLSNPAGGVNLYGRFRELIAPSERFTHEDFKVKFGIANYNYMGMKAVMENRGTGGQVKILTTSTWVFGGQEIPRELLAQRIIGSDAEERRFVQWAFVGCKQPRRNIRLTGFTG